MNCLVCNSSSTQQIYANIEGASITSLGAAINSPTRVYYCDHCGHLQNEQTIDTDHYYDQHYNINTDSEDEDQLYALVDGKPVFRSAHQSRTALARMGLEQGARILDYGCGSGHIAAAISSQRGDLDINLFDISENYKASWSRWVREDKMACYTLPDDWAGTFDAAVSFFALEHADAPRSFADDLYRMLKPGGQAYLVVPNTFENVADLIVVDHLNHFSSISLRLLLEQAGFIVSYLSDKDHESAWTVVAHRPVSTPCLSPAPDPKARDEIRARARSMADFWLQCDARITAFESAHATLPATIYGSGFYGSYLYSRLNNPDSIEGFVDRNPHQQKKQHFGRPVAAPDAIDASARVVWVGLNPRVAKDAIAQLSAWRDRPYTYFYL